LCSPATCRSSPTTSASASRTSRSTSTTRCSPASRGARPYHQAHARGVKVIGATAHYVTADLDEGPITAQETLPVDHSLTADEYAARGREAECRALARAVRWHTENRVLVNGRRTVVLK
jgi:formyltetrahydrofolate deformylase